MHVSPRDVDFVLSHPVRAAAGEQVACALEQGAAAGALEIEAQPWIK